jgi:hypothetical protein
MFKSDYNWERIKCLLLTDLFAYQSCIKGISNTKCKRHLIKEEMFFAILPITTPWPEAASELYRREDRRLSAKLVPAFADKGCHVVSVTDPYGRILGFLDRCPIDLPSLIYF